jgi:hypothetical protein
MRFSSMRSAIVIASVIVGSVVPSQAFAQIDVLTGLSGFGYSNDVFYESVYTFRQSMILNSIGFYTRNQGLSFVSYKINNDEFSLDESMLSGVDANGLQWYTLANGGLSVNATSVITVSTQGSVYYPPDDGIGPQPEYNITYDVGVGSNNASSNVTYNGSYENSAYRGATRTNSNLRVSNPGSNVAPEPGTFALALTGGGALLGICIRRRRNAA